MRLTQGANAMGDRVQLAEHAANIGGGFRRGGGFASTGKFLGQVSDGLDLMEAQAKYMRDTRRMSADEAWVDNYGRWAIERGGGAMGGGVGATLGGAAAGALTGGLLRRLVQPWAARLAMRLVHAQPSPPPTISCRRIEGPRKSESTLCRNCRISRASTASWLIRGLY